MLPRAETTKRRRSKMNALIEKLRNDVRYLSDRIHELKEEEKKTEPGQEMLPVTPDGKVWRGLWVDRPEGTDYKMMPSETIIDHVKPGSPRWDEYVSLKRQASVALTARKIAAALDLDKGADEEETSVGAILKLMRDDPALRSHCYARGGLSSLSAMACAASKVLRAAAREEVTA
jgi:hypothetical protein